MMKNKPRFTCCICHQEFEGWGNYPAPVSEEGLCCDYCFESIVGLHRLLVELINDSPSPQKAI